LGVFCFDDGIKLQKLVGEDLKIKMAKISNQIVQRDIYAEIISSLAILASTLDKIALEIRNLQRTEVMEIAEAFGSIWKKTGRIFNNATQKESHYFRKDMWTCKSYLFKCNSRTFKQFIVAREGSDKLLLREGNNSRDFHSYR